MQTFHSKIDNWLLVILALLIITSILGVYISLTQGQTISYLAAVGMLLLGVGMPIWIGLSTQYVVTDRELRVQSGPFRWIVPLSTIASVQATHNPLSGPALSLDRLEIKYGNGRPRSIIVSPANKSAFLSAIGQPVDEL
ncbi:PH domain-containing protein [filamentous cyanobacterium LEGE 11480]|uniref:PH domain-containing protein n=1 Tax=Romeriopsis navalis LEGE 11480 TaxID=2777977 RepID=A0A928VJR8_9CYAN|nr:PH domain-containing protein [Romeriopsis navalis]MBE9029018.1 PH domain-containing protein [Romeriopsis navalis LEGE 11480]